MPADVAAMIGRPMYPQTADFCAETAYGWNILAATENGNPLYWNAAVADALTAGAIMPLSTLSLWMRPHHWAPDAANEQAALWVHSDLKERLGLPEAIISDNAVLFDNPVRPGDVISHHQVLRSVSEPETTRLGSGRFWVIDVEYRNQSGDLVGVESCTGFGYRRADGANPASDSAGSRPDPLKSGPAPQADTATTSETGPVPQTGTATQTDTASKSGPAPAPSEPATRPAWDGSQTWAKPDPAHDQVRVGDALPVLTHHVTATTVVLGALASRDWRPMHHDYRFATERNSTRDIFLNTSSQLAFIERAVTDWTGPKGRMGRVSFRMHEPVFPGDTMTITSEVTAVPIDESGCGWAELAIGLRSDDRLCATATARVALPMWSSDNPWRRRGEDWQP